MDAADYASEASLYYAKNTHPKQKSLVYRKFAIAAEAIRFAVEELSPKVLNGCSLEVNDIHYFGRQIRPLYDDCAFPLRRKTVKARSRE